MGKAKNKGAAAAAPPKCTCDHPFQCSCGNRPERPSKGHKWYPEDQVWAGKGHKQKGASGQTATVSEQAKITEKGKTQVEQWQRLPSQLLQEFCSRQKRPTPKYKNMEKGAGVYKYRVVVCDPKESDKDLFFVPAHAVANEEQAKEEGALLALLQLTPALPHERKLPEPYKTTWLNAIQKQKNAASTKPKASRSNNGEVTSSNKSSSAGGAVASSNLTLGSSYISNAAKRQQMEEKRRLQNARVQKHDAIRMANQNHPVFMSATIRKQIEGLLRGDGSTTLELDNESDNEEDAENPPVGEDDAKVYIVHRLHTEGFTQRQARAAYDELVRTNTKYQGDDETLWDQLYEECLQWLVVHLNEDQLPEGFDPRGRTLDVIVAASATRFKVVATIDVLGDTSSTVTGLGDAGSNASSIAFAARHGITVQEATLIDSLATKQEKSALDVFWHTIREAAGVSSDDVVLSHGATDEMSDMAKDELEALFAIFDSGCTVCEEENGCLLVRVALEVGTMSLEVLVEDGVYPGVFPKRVVVSGTWPSKVGAALHVELATFVADLPLGEPMIFAIHAHAQDLLQSDELIGLSLMPNLGIEEKNSPSESVDTSRRKQQGSTSKVEPVSRPVVQQRRPREKRKTFWSIRPRDTPPAVAFPKVTLSMKRTRECLPAFSSRNEFLAAVKKAEQSSRVVLVTGETGSGKSTQLPAYLLEDDPKGAKIVVVQPRRLAATGVANRVAEERGEKQPGVESVGYVVRGDSAMCNRSRLIFCTTGVLLRQLQNEGAFECVTTIVVDEVHERTLDGDVLLGLLKQSLPAHPHLRVVLMSATLDTERFANYWGLSPVPHVHIPGRTFPVNDFMLEDVLSLTGYIPTRKKKGKFSFAPRQRNQASPWNDSEKSEDELGDDENEQAQSSTSSISGAQHGIPIGDLVKRIDETTLDANLVCRLVKHLVLNKDPNDDGSLLVFLAGAPEINEVLETIKRGTKGLPIVLLPLHGGLQPKEQNRVFRPAAQGFTKVVLSTNVAETSVTIPDCTVVIDTGREKQASYDPANRMPMLVEQFASKASMKQRRGRAGRVREGTCYKLISRATYASLKDHSEPEIRRVALDQTLLQLLFLGVEHGSGTFMRTLLDPPSKESLDAAAFSLQKLGAVDQGKSEGDLILTPLGAHLAGIPAPPSVGKMLVMGSILGCREAALAMAAGISLGRSPFLRIDNPKIRRNKEEDDPNSIEIAKQQRILEERATFIKAAGNSDHALLAAVFMKWKATGTGMRKLFCESLGLSSNGLHDMSQLVSQLHSSLVAAGFAATTESDRYVSSWRIIHACAVSAMAPSQLVKVRRPVAKYQETAEGAKEKGGEARELAFFIRIDDLGYGKSPRAQEERVFLHPASTQFGTGNYSCPWLVYHSMVRTSKPYLRDVTECSAYALLLLGGELEIRASKGVIAVDGWAELAANARIGSLLGGLRRRIDTLLAEKIKNPSIDITASQEMKLVVKLIMTDGLGT